MLEKWYLDKFLVVISHIRNCPESKGNLIRFLKRGCLCLPSAPLLSFSLSPCLPTHTFACDHMALRTISNPLNSTSLWRMKCPMKPLLPQYSSQNESQRYLIVKTHFFYDTETHVQRRTRKWGPYSITRVRNTS